MRKLGLIGGTGPESTLIYYRELTKRVAEETGNILPPLTIESLSVYKILDYCRKDDMEGLTAYLLEGIQCLARAGAEAACLTGITPHIVFPELEVASSIPLISIIDAACEYCERAGYRKIAILGTAPTMSGTFFKSPFISKGIDVVVPSIDEQAYIGSVIETELERGLIQPETVEKIKKITERLILDDHAEAIVLGCTELPLVYDRIFLPVEKIDVMKIHIEKLTEFILSTK